MDFAASQVAAYKDRYRKYNGSETGCKRHANHEKTDGRKAYNEKRYTESYLSRPFVGWDGEGITINGEHRYVMLANSAGGYLEDLNGIKTVDAFEFMLAEKKRLGDAIHIVFAGGYDVNMILRDLTKEHVRGIYKNDWYTLGRYRIQWRQSKSFFIKHADEKGGFTLYDVWPFFQCSFVNACDSYLGERFVNRDIIVSNKGARSTFRIEDLREIQFYNEQELVNLVELANELRARLDKVGLRLSRWDGPGAIASALLTKQGIKNAMATCPPDVARAARFAYAGGRFEVIKNGNVDAPAYEYDVNSAYPFGLGFVPNLADGEWVHYSGEQIRPQIEWNSYTLFHAYYSGTDPNIPQPLFVRMRNGNIIYPLKAQGWYWGPEIYAAQEFVKRYGGTLTILEAWHFKENDPQDKPFSFIEPLYNKRRALKKAGDGAHVGIKLGLNSLYGKLCQQIGFRELPNGTQLPPSFHQLEWGGFITSLCRARVFLAGIENLSAVIAYETDAVFSSEPLPVKVSSNLGDFEATTFRSLLYAVSGLYFGVTADGKRIDKTRGVDRGSITKDDVASAMSKSLAKDRAVSATLTRFIGAGLALQTDWSLWRTWQQTPKRVVIEPSTKRIHERCVVCNVPGFKGLRKNVWHQTEPYMPFTKDGHISAEFPILWINPDPNMTDLEELRNTHKELEGYFHE